MPRQCHQNYPDSLTLLANARAEGRVRRQIFWNGVAALKEYFELLESPQISSSHNGRISSLDIAEGRFLLAGGGDATISIYDLSIWGTEQHLNGDSVGDGNNTGHRRQIHKPVAQSVRAPPTTENSLEIPVGHSLSVVAAQWYPVDTGAFVSAGSDGSMLVWDTNAMAPVAMYRPFQQCRCFDMSGPSQSLLAVGGSPSSSVKLVDLRSGAASHTLVAHRQNVTAIQWSQTCQYVLSSGSNDGAVVLWDIRKSGSNACTTILDRDASSNLPISPGKYSASYRHLRKRQQSSTHVAKRTASGAIAPSNFSQVESSTVQSHGGAISAINFCPDGQFLVTTGRDGKLCHWDLRSGRLVPTHFYWGSRPNQPAVLKHNKRVPMVIPPSPKSNMAWVGHGDLILGYALDKGGKPAQRLEGHLDSVTSLAVDEVNLGLISGGKDGMILVWGSSQRRANEIREVKANQKVARSSSSREAREELVTGEGDRDYW